MPTLIYPCPIWLSFLLFLRHLHLFLPSLELFSPRFSHGLFLLTIPTNAINSDCLFQTIMSNVALFLFIQSVTRSSFILFTGITAIWKKSLVVSIGANSICWINDCWLFCGFLGHLRSKNSDESSMLQLSTHPSFPCFVCLFHVI